MINMNYATNFAMLDGANVVSGVAWGMVYNMPQDFNCVQCDDRPVRSGDVYDPETGKFYRDGVEVLTQAEQYAADLAAIEDALGVGTSSEPEQNPTEDEVIA